MIDEEVKCKVSVWQRPTSVVTTAQSWSYALLVPEPLPPPYREPRYTAVVVGSWHGDFKTVAPYRHAAFEDCVAYLKGRGFETREGDGFSAILGAVLEQSYLVVIGIVEKPVIRASSVLLDPDNIAVRSFPLYGNTDANTFSHFRPSGHVLPVGKAEEYKSALMGCTVPLTREAAVALTHGCTVSRHLNVSAIEFSWLDTQRTVGDKKLDCAGNRRLAAYFFDHELGFLVTPALHATFERRFDLMQLKSLPFKKREQRLHVDFHEKFGATDDEGRSIDFFVRIVAVDRAASRDRLLKPECDLASSEPRPLPSRAAVVPVVELWVNDEQTAPGGPQTEVSGSKPPGFYCIDMTKLEAELTAVIESCRTAPIDQGVLMVHVPRERTWDAFHAVGEALNKQSKTQLRESVVVRRYSLVESEPPPVLRWHSKALRADVIAASRDDEALSAAELRRFGPLVRGLSPVRIEDAFGAGCDESERRHTYRATFVLEALSTVHSVAFNVPATKANSMPRGGMTLSVLGGMTLAPVHQTVLLHAADILVPIGADNETVRVEYFFPDTVPKDNPKDGSKELNAMVEVHSDHFKSKLAGHIASPPVRFVTFVFEVSGQHQLSLGHLWVSGTMVDSSTSSCSCLSEASSVKCGVQPSSLIQQLLTMTVHNAARLPASGREVKLRLHQVASIPRGTLQLGVALQGHHSAVYDPEWYGAGVSRDGQKQNMNTLCRNCGELTRHEEKRFSCTDICEKCASADLATFKAYPDSVAERTAEPGFRSVQWEAATRAIMFKDWDGARPLTNVMTRDDDAATPSPRLHFLKGLVLEWLGEVGESHCPFAIERAARALLTRGRLRTPAVTSIGNWLPPREETCRGLQCRVLIPVWATVRRVVMVLRGSGAASIKLHASIGDVLNTEPSQTVDAKYSCATDDPSLVTCTFKFSIDTPVKVVTVWTEEFTPSHPHEGIDVADIAVFGRYPKEAATGTMREPLEADLSRLSSNLMSTPATLRIDAASPITLLASQATSKDRSLHVALSCGPKSVAGIHLTLSGNCSARAIRIFLISAVGTLHPVRLLHLPVVDPGHCEARPCLEKIPDAAPNSSPKATANRTVSFTFPECDLRGVRLADVLVAAVHIEVALELRVPARDKKSSAIEKCTVYEWASGAAAIGATPPSSTQLASARVHTYVPSVSQFTPPSTGSQEQRDGSLSRLLQPALVEDDGPKLFRAVGALSFDACDAESHFYEEEREHFCGGRHSGFYY